MVPGLMCILIPPTSFMYVLIFLMIPFLCYLNEEKDSDIDKIYSFMFAVLFSIIIIPVSFPSSPYSITGCFIMQVSTVFFFLFALCRNAFINMIKYSKEVRKKI